MGTSTEKVKKWRQNPANRLRERQLCAIQLLLRGGYQVISPDGLPCQRKPRKARGSSEKGGDLDG